MRGRIGSEIIAIVCSDLHLSHKPPIWRSCEPDWYAAMKRQLLELADLQTRLDDTLIYCAGDIFDKWNAPAELINFAINTLPPMLAIPGQHDMPSHNFEELDRSAYGTINYANAIRDISGGDDESQLGWRGFEWGAKPPQRKGEEFFGVSLIHEYVWMPGKSYKNDAEGGNTKQIAIKYDSKLVVSGDNHIHFYDKTNNVYNCGGFFRRTKDQIDHHPCVGLVYSDFHVVPYRMDISADRHLSDEQTAEIVKANEDLKLYIAGLGALGETNIDFHNVVTRYMERTNVSGKVRQYLRKCLLDEA